MKKAKSTKTAKKRVNPRNIEPDEYEPYGPIYAVEPLRTNLGTIREEVTLAFHSPKGVSLVGVWVELDGARMASTAFSFTGPSNEKIRIKIPSFPPSTPPDHALQIWDSTRTNLLAEVKFKV